MGIMTKPVQSVNGESHLKRESEDERKKTIWQHYGMTAASTEASLIFPQLLLCHLNNRGNSRSRNKQGINKSHYHCIKGLIKVIKIQWRHSSAVFILSLLSCSSPMSNILEDILKVTQKALHRVRWNLRVVSMCVSLMTKVFEHYFKCFSSIWDSFLEDSA